MFDELGVLPAGGNANADWMLQFGDPYAGVRFPEKEIPKIPGEVHDFPLGV
jgi:hypothetical protein